MVTTYDPIRAEQERIENEMQNAQAEFERSKPQPQDKASVRARKKSGRDRIRASAKGHQDVIEKYQAKYVGPVPSRPSAPSGGTAKVGSGWTLEGNYGTRKDANLVARNLKSSGMFTMVRRMGDGSYNVWKREGATVKSYKLKLDKKGKGRKGRGGEDRELAPPSEARWVDFGTLPEYKPPNFQLDKSGYKPLDYKPIETKSFQYTGFKTMTYKPIGTEPYYKPSGVGDQPYYKKFEYRPIGQFGTVINNPPNISGLQGEPVKRKKRKSKEPRMVGE